VPDVLHPEVVLIAEEVRQVLIASTRVAEHRGDSGRGLVEGVRPVLDANPPVQHGVLMIRDVAHGIDVRVTRAQRRIDEDAVVDLEVAQAGQRVFRRHTHAGDDDVGRNLVVVDPHPGGQAVVDEYLLQPYSQP